MKKLLILITLLVLVAGCTQAKTTQTPTPTAGPKKASASGGASAQGYVTPVRHADLSFRTGGRVAEVLVKEGDQVKTGQPLVKLQDAELKAALAAAQAELKRLQVGTRPEEIAQAQANVSVAEGQVKSAQNEVDRVKGGAQQAADLADAQAQFEQAKVQLKDLQDTYDSVVSGRDTCKEYGVQCGGLGLREEQLRVQLAAAKAGYNAAQARVAQVYANKGDDLRSVQAKLNIANGQRDEALAQLNLLKAGSTQEQIDAAKARVDQAQAALDETVLVAPFDGTIAEMLTHIGEIVSPGPRVASLADLTQWLVETDDLSEVDVVNVQPGAEASIKVDALPGVSLKGQVKSIVPRSAVKRGDVTYTVKVAISDPDPRLKWGMTAFVDIQGK
jgi:multidrug resistance efflux pump